MIPYHRRCLILGLDGATFDLLDPWMAAGRLPFLASLVERGLSAPLTSVFPPKTIPAWYSFATGLDPGALGMFGFTEPDGGPGKSRLIQSYRPAEAVWDRLSRQGHTVGIVNFPIGAAHAVNGFFVPGMFSERPQTHPAPLGGELDRIVGEEYLHELPPYRASERARWMELALRSVRQRARTSIALLERFEPELLFVLFRETDRVEHQHWAELARPMRETPSDLIAFWAEVDRACAEVDARFRALGGPAVTLVVSDHGHGPAESDFFTNRWLAERGYLAFNDGGAVSLRRRVISRALLALDRFGPARRLLRPIADRLQGGPRGEQVAQFVTGDGSFEGMAGRIDWARTVAYSYPVPEGIYLNPYRSDLGEEARAELVAKLRRELESYPEAHIEVFEPKEIYRAVNHAKAPALLLRVNRLQAENRMDFTYAHAMMTERPAYFYGTGVHRMDGVLIASGPGVRPTGRLSQPFSLLDLAPTVLETFGLSVPPELGGRSFASSLRPAAG